MFTSVQHAYGTPSKWCVCISAPHCFLPLYPNRALVTQALSNLLKAIGDPATGRRAEVGFSRSSACVKNLLVVQNQQVLCRQQPNFITQ